MYIYLKVCLLFCFIWLAGGLNSSWRWECEDGRCQKHRITEDNESSALSLPACQLLCLPFGGLWPQPTGKVLVGTELKKVNVSNISFGNISLPTSSATVLQDAFHRFKIQTQQKQVNKIRNDGISIFIGFEIDDPKVFDPVLNINESYHFQTSKINDELTLNVIISANNVFGVRHALETLGQLIILDDLRDEILVPSEIQISDAPVYAYRGLLLDTARNYISANAIKRNLDAMASTKLNRFHWHISDSQSFPFYSKSQPQLSKLGAYSPQKIYTPEQIKDIVEYARVRGIKVVPEFDAPAHVGEGWQDTEFVVCFNKRPWNEFCEEPPCGQFDPTVDELYTVLGDIYADILELFNPDLFHMGGDEVNFDCWKSEDKISDWLEKKGWKSNSSSNEENNYIKLWDYFQSNALAQLDSKSQNEKPIILWTSTLTESENVTKYLPTDRYIIQIWTTSDDEHISELLDNGYKIILSNYDALYLDCGFAGWVTDGNNWCSPYKGWQLVYSNDPAQISNKTDQIIGSEAVLWTEQVDDNSVDGRFWPRAAALAEVLWSEPTTTWQEAEARMLVQRERLIRDTGVNAETLEPEWCLQNENNCPLPS